MKNTYFSLLDQYKALGGEEQYEQEHKDDYRGTPNKKLGELRHRIKNIERKLQSREIIEYTREYLQRDDAPTKQEEVKGEEL